MAEKVALVQCQRDNLVEVWTNNLEGKQMWETTRAQQMSFPKGMRGLSVYLKGPIMVTLVTLVIEPSVVFLRSNIVFRNPESEGESIGWLEKNQMVVGNLPGYNVEHGCKICLGCVVRVTYFDDNYCCSPCCSR